MQTPTRREDSEASGGHILGRVFKLRSRRISAGSLKTRPRFVASVSTWATPEAVETPEDQELSQTRSLSPLRLQIPPRGGCRARVGNMRSPAIQSQRMTYAEYLKFEANSATKHAYVNGEVYAMAGGTPEHAQLQAKIIYLLTAALAGRPCAVFTSDLRVRIEATGRSTYPDATVVCERIARAEDDRTYDTWLVEPACQVVEVQCGCA
jgi:hypothetical protein